MKQLFIDRYFSILFLFTLIFGVLLYQTIGFTYTDELCTLALFLFFIGVMLKTPDWRFNKAFLFTLGVFAFYTLYSIWIGSNSKTGIFNDLVIQMKPYMAFFCVYQLMPVLSESRKKLLKEVALLFWVVFLLPVGITSLVYEKIFTVTMRHPLYYGISVTVVSLCYLYCSAYTWRDRIVFLVLLSLGIFCGRAKFYGFFAISFFTMLFFANISRFRLNFKNSVLIVAMLGVMTLVAWNKISYYFFQAIMGNSMVDEDTIARFVLYRTFPEVLHDYFPFGSGLASFATYSSGEYYSELYTEYGIDIVWGISKQYHNFISDTYYPSLAQFGVAGIVLYLLFWVYILRKAFLYYQKTKDSQSFVIIILIVGFLAIEGTTAATFIAQGGFFVMMMTGLLLAGMKRNATSGNLK
ncbi:MAG: O-antigen ligase domain-containing protein [Tannerella sp.]|jgi:hypothetical protein|nr:O-antigen ligase domain-containing protein [Tannerella sp.]